MMLMRMMAFCNVDDDDADDDGDNDDDDDDGNVVYQDAHAMSTTSTVYAHE